MIGERGVLSVRSAGVRAFVALAMILMMLPLAASAGTTPSIVLSHYSFAEGCTVGGFETWVLAMNPGSSPVTADLSFATESGDVPGPQDRVIEPGQRMTFDAGAYVRSAHVSPQLVSTGPLAVERSCYWNSRAGGHAAPAIPAPASAWYFAEGSTANGFETWLLVANPGSETATVDISFATENGEIPGPRGLAIEPGHRETIDASRYVTSAHVSAAVVSDRPVVAERSCYWNSRAGGSCSPGLTDSADSWYFAEGCTVNGFETWVLVMNPGSEPATVDISFATADGIVPGPRNQLIEAHRRATYDASAYVSSAHVSPIVTSDKGVVAERSCYWNQRAGGHNSTGASAGATDYRFAEGCTVNGFETWVLVANPGTETATVNISFGTEAGIVPGPAGLAVAAGRRISIDAGAYISSAHVAPLVTSDKPIVAERSCYWNSRDGGSCAAGSQHIATTGRPDQPVPGGGNKAPVADAGIDQTVYLLDEVTLNGEASFDRDGDPLTYSWSILSKPDGSEAALDDPTLATPTFTADRTGTYGCQLVVSDGRKESKPDSVAVVCVPPDLSNPIAADDFERVASFGMSYLAANSAGKELLYLEGAAYDRGYAEGWLCPEGAYRMTHDYVTNFLAGFLSGFTGGLSNEAPPEMIEAVREVLLQAVHAQEYAVPQEFREEMRGIADGATAQGYDVSYDDVLLINVGFDMLYSLVYQGGSLLCNELAVFGEGTTDGRLYHGRDFMFSTGGGVFSDEALVIVMKPDEGYPFAAAAVPGFVGLPTGMNSEGISFAMDMVPNRQNRAVFSGMGCLLLCRNVVQHTATMEEGIEMVRNTSRAVSWLYMIADGKIPDAAVLETVADSMVASPTDVLGALSGLVPGFGDTLAQLEAQLPQEVAEGLHLLLSSGELVQAGADSLPVLGDIHPDRGVAVRASDYVDPAGLEQFRLVIPMPDPQVP
ncbi:MAG: C45 family autoproteolytic acyltransferase/hydrolase, partial [Candidatus Geothermincolia bacterium]